MCLNTGRVISTTSTTRSAPLVVALQLRTELLPGRGRLRIFPLPPDVRQRFDIPWRKCSCRLVDINAERRSPFFRSVGLNHRQAEKNSVAVRYIVIHSSRRPAWDFLTVNHRTKGYCPLNNEAVILFSFTIEFLSHLLKDVTQKTQNTPLVGRRSVKPIHDWIENDTLPACL